MEGKQGMSLSQVAVEEGMTGDSPQQGTDWEGVSRRRGVRGEFSMQ